MAIVKTKTQKWINDSRKALQSTFGIGKHIKRRAQSFKDDARKRLY